MKKIFLALSLLGLTGSIWANEAVLKAVSGPVTIESGATSQPALEGKIIRGNDRVRVGPGAVAQIVFTNGDAILLKENSNFQLKQDKSGTFVSVDEGEFLIGLPGKRKAGETFRVKTPAALVVAREGVFWGKSDASKKSDYACFKGSLDVMALEKKINLKANQTLQISFGQAPSGPTVSKIDPIYVNTFAVNGSLQGVDKMLK